MINQVFAQNFVRKMYRQMNLKVNVMNEKGVILASATPERVGDFHMCAYEIIQKGLNMSVTETPTRDLIGVNAPGVNLRLVNNNETIGVIGVSGRPDEVMALAKMVKLTFETMYEYEYKRQNQINAKDTLGRFAYTLLRELPFQPAAAARAAKKLGFKDDFPRIPILISFHEDQRLLSFMEWYGGSHFSHSQDMLLPIDGSLLLCKSWGRHELPTGEVREYCAQLISGIEKEFFQFDSSSDAESPARFFIAPVQTRFSDYHKIYPYFQFFTSRPVQDGQPVYFLTDYLVSLMAWECQNMRPLLSWYCAQVEEHLDRQQFLETVSALVRCDMKADAAATSLHLHKNSVMARLKKIKEILGVSPLSSRRDAAFLTVLCELLQLAG